MRTFQQVAALRTYLRGIRNEGKTIGFVPTMGALHEGHLSLIRRAKGDCDIAVVSIFVNPLQFNESTDFEQYPRDLHRDMQIASVGNVDALFHPSDEEIYAPGYQTIVDVPQLGSVLEGAHRPGHFRGVTTVVTKLLNIIAPEQVYFGQKDYQQWLLIDRLVRDLNMSVKVVPVTTVREPDGLAFSSRNVRLSADERRAAPVLYRALQKANALIHASESQPLTVIAAMEELFAEEPLAQVEYIALVHPETLEPLETLAESVVCAAVAVRFGSVRLIDNMLIAPPGVAFSRVQGGMM